MKKTTYLQSNVNTAGEKNCEYTINGGRNEESGKDIAFA